MKSFEFLGSAVLAVAALTMSGCVSVPTADIMKSRLEGYELPKLPDPGQALVYVVRPSGAGTLVRFNVFLDDQEDKSEMGYTRGSQYIYFGVRPGHHKIYSKAENWAEIEFDAKPDEVIYLQQETNMGIIMARNNLSRLDDLTGKYQIKTNKIGTPAETPKPDAPK